MTVQNVITELENKGAVHITPAKPQENAGAKIYRIYYRVPINAEVDSEPRHVDLVGDSATNVKYHKEIPDILKAAPVTTPTRDFHLTDTQIKTGLESQNQGWKVLQINKVRNGDLDQVTVKASAGQNVVTKRYAVWKEGANVEYQEEA